MEPGPISHEPSARLPPSISLRASCTVMCVPITISPVALLTLSLSLFCRAFPVSCALPWLGGGAGVRPCSGGSTSVFGSVTPVRFLYDWTYRGQVSGHLLLHVPRGLEAAPAGWTAVSQVRSPPLRSFLVCFGSMKHSESLRRSPCSRCCFPIN